MFKLALIFIFLSTLNSFAQTAFDLSRISNEAKLVLRQIENDNSVPADSIGIRFSYLPKDYPLTVLREKVPVTDLRELIKHDNPIVRCYAFKALTMVSEADAFSMVTEHLQDTIAISTHYGCFGSNEFVGDFF